MQDVTGEVLKAFDKSSQGKIEKLTRLDLLKEQLKKVAGCLDRGKDFRMIVLNQDGGLEQEEFGPMWIASAMVEDYSATHTMRIQSELRSNTIILQLGKPLATVADTKKPEEQKLRIW